MKVRWWLIAVLVGCVIGQVSGSTEEWTHLGRDTSRQSIAADGPRRLLAEPNEGCWKVTTDPCAPQQEILFEGASGAVLYEDLLYAYAQYADPHTGRYTASQVVAFDANTGQVRWSRVIDQAHMYGSHSTPSVDCKHRTVLIGSGTRVFALDAQDGRLSWSTWPELRGPIINASVCVAEDLPHARAFVTDYDPLGEPGAGALYCINLDTRESDNPWDPGEVVWDVTLGHTSGNTPSYNRGRVFVADADGGIRAFDAVAISQPAAIWDIRDRDRIRGIFMGGVAVTPRGFLYAATYNWDTTSGENNSTLIKVDVTDGRIAWTVPVERTNTTPVVVGDALYVSAGIVGPYGSRPKVQCFRDTGQGAERVWETGAGLNVGSWTSQPVYAWGKLYVGAQDEAYGVDWRPNGQGYLYILDLTKDPHDPAFVLASVKGVGNSPVVTHNSVYSVGPKAVARFHEPLFLADINGDGTVNELDRQGILDVMGQGYPLGTIRTDLDLDGDVDQADLEILEAERVGIESREYGYDEAAI